MNESNKGKLVIFLILLTYVLTFIGFLLLPSADIVDSIIRLCALLGYVSMTIAAIMTPFAVQLYKIFKKNFIKMHHAFALSGLILITLHPVIFSISVLNIMVFVPVIDDWILFWELAGRPALILIYIAVVAGFLRNRIKKYWKTIHALLYIALFFGLVHGTLIGTSFQNALILFLFYSLFIILICAFIYKRYQVYKRKKKKTS